MRVIAGRAKGHKLRAPHGLETRPTSDKVREALFSILADTFVGESVLDLFAGTGALGIEALSRGAADAVFVERNSPSCKVIRTNLEHTRLTEHARVLCMPVERALTVLSQTFGLILLDPPYAHHNLHDIMSMVGGAPIFGIDSIVVFEHSSRFVVEKRYARLELRRQKVYGDSALSIYDVREEQDA